MDKIEKIISIFKKEEWSIDKIIKDEIEKIDENKLSDNEKIIINSIIQSFTKDSYINKIINKDYNVYEYDEFYDIYTKRKIKKIDFINDLKIKEDCKIYIENKFLKNEKIINLENLERDVRIRLYK
jgi:hypothetical protein